MKNIFIIIYLQFFLLTSCHYKKPEVNDKESVIGSVDSVKQLYYNRGMNYSLKVYYNYYVDNVSYNTSSDNPSPSKFPFVAPIAKGDSVLVVFSKYKPSNSKAIKRKYIKKLNYIIN